MTQQAWAPPPECVVEYDNARVTAARRTVLKSARTAGIVLVVGGVVTLGVQVLYLLLPADNYGIAAFGSIGGLLLLGDGIRRLAKARALAADWAARGLPPVALHLGPAGLRCWFESAHNSVFLPWPAVAGFHLEGKPAHPYLVLDPVPGVPGGQGFDQPGLRRLSIGVRSLRQPLPEIDRVLAQFTGGRVRVHPGSR